MQEDSMPGQECPALTQVGILLRSSTSDGLFSPSPPTPLSPLALSLYPNSCPPSFSPCCWCHKKISQTDSLRQMVLQALQAFCMCTPFMYIFFPPKKLYKQVRWGLCPWETSDEILTSIVAWAVSHLAAMNGEYAGRFLSCAASGIRHSDSQLLLESKQLPNQTLWSSPKDVLKFSILCSKEWKRKILIVRV